MSSQLDNPQLIRDKESDVADRRRAGHRAEREVAARKAVEGRLAALEARLGHGGQDPTDAG